MWEQKEENKKKLTKEELEVLAEIKREMETEYREEREELEQLRELDKLEGEEKEKRIKELNKPYEDFIKKRRLEIQNMEYEKKRIRN